MVEYNIVKHCNFCKGRFVVSRSESKNIFCYDCQIKFNDENARR